MRPVLAMLLLASLAPAAHQASVPQNAQVLGNRWLGDAGPVSEGPHGLFAVSAQPLEDRPTGRIGERPEQDVVRVGHRNE